ncbi:transmembrane protein 94 isoform X2 [Plodia interpunctella]|uniref:transmembrane protein 94 isoform X2 n=1 Tax=Plodia interpunctella TaxID=58824 RepID=UPI002368150E|nr:transmembrane protein 94 isoform X2 [Plodia interpunctella]
MDETPHNILGYSTKEALIKLRNDITNVIADHKQKIPSGLGLVRNIISFSSEKVLLSGVAYTITLIYSVSLILTYLLGHTHAYLLWEALFLLIILVINFIVAYNEEYLRRNEIPHRVKKVLETLEIAIKRSKWNEEHFPHLCAPFSPCVILQWTYRDATIVNLPWALLVEGDVVVLRPGQEVPGHCQGLQPEDPELFFGQIFQPNPQRKEGFSAPRVRTPHQNRAYRMCETPYLKNLKLALEQATARPVTIFEKQRYLCTVKIMEGIVLPLVIALVVVGSFVRHMYQLPGGKHWAEIYLLQTIAASLPLLQIIFPIAWVSLTCYGLARFKLLSETRQKYIRPKSCSISEDASDPLIQALSESNLKPESLKSLGKTFFNILTGREDMVARTANIVHVLGSISALCCVDKKGILSWPNPTAEKVFFLRNSSPASNNSSKTSLVGSMGHHSPTADDVPDKQTDPSTIVEVLDLTHDQNAPFCVEWDDARWRQHLSRLKPLGLAALLNTCAPTPRHTYAHFCAHLTCEAQYSEDLVPVTNRRCLCELAKQIGFSDAVADAYTIHECLPIFRHLQADTIRRETRFVKSLQLSTRVKVPLPHMLCVLVRDHAGQLQMLSQGTADIVLDSCVDYWNGRDLTQISPADRKKIIDFYQRNSLTAYCTAFAYKPLTRSITPALAHMYLELPADSRQLYVPHSENWPDMPALHFHSTDSLLFNEVSDEDVDDADGYFDMQCNQVFIGMVTMQYQAQSDMVELIERLERACIRFVHFSKENELRSRVFSEKMGLESGWNCHISLISDEKEHSTRVSPLSSQTLPQGRGRANTTTQRATYSNNMASSKALSVSAPGAINLDHATVKFDSEIKKARHSITTHNGLKMPRGSIPASHQSTDSLLEGEGAESPADACRSLSCLTDSTDHSAPVNFDMSNRAKLPRGIENIRPHIEKVDNVPLLVSLFTDCNARSVHLMIQIMQDYGEVVCVMGSAANCLNMEIFMQADASIAVEPLYPVLCQKMPPYLLPEKCIGPIDLARALNSIPCSLSMTRDADVSLFTLITMSRHFMTCLWNSTQFWMCGVCYIALLQVGSLCSLLPLALSVGGATWSSTLSVPLLATALAFAPLDAAVMQRAATRPTRDMKYKMALFVFWCYSCKFLPSAIFILTIYALTLRTFCEQLATATNSTGCWLVYPTNLGEVTDEELDLSRRSFHGWREDFYDGFYLAQNLVLAMVTLHLIVISLSFVHRQSSIWQRRFWTNKVWCGSVVVLLILQAAFTAKVLSVPYGLCEKWSTCGLQFTVSAPLWAACGGSTLLVFIINELLKWQEIKVDTRNQRRARLDFGTKLGMNSPF